VERACAGAYQANHHRHGQFLMRVQLTVDDPPDAEPFVYTIGNHEHGMPELLYIGAADDGFSSLLNMLGEMQRRRGKAFADGELVETGALYPIRMQDGGLEARTDYAVQAGVFYGTDVFADMQIIIPVRNGRWPEDPACDPAYAGQKILSRSSRSAH
jgi:hypothetical protein